MTELGYKRILLRTVLNTNILNNLKINGSSFSGTIVPLTAIVPMKNRELPLLSGLKNKDRTYNNRLNKLNFLC